MKKKNKSPLGNTQDLRGFEDFIKEVPSSDSMTSMRGVSGLSNKNDSNFENYTFITNDAERINKLNNLLKDKIDFLTRFDQSGKIIQKQKKDILELKDNLFTISDKENSAYRRSLSDVFDTFFITTKREP
jgi:hypothetical protein